MNKRIVLAVFVSVFLLSTMFGKGFVTTVSASTTLEGVWSQKSNMTYPRQYPNMGVVNGKIYVVGGRACKNDPDVGTRYKYNEEYDPATDTWTTKTPKATAGDAGASGVVDGKFYIIGQYPSGTENYCYAPIENSWTKKADMPTKRWDSIGLVLTDPIGNDVIYAIGGCADGTPFKTVEVYCPNNDTWKSKASMNKARSKLAGCVCNGKIYVFSSNYGTGLTNSAEVYDPSTNTWTNIASSPERVMCANQFAINGKIYLLKVGRIGPSYIPNHWVYDPEIDTYETAKDFELYDGLTPSLERPVINNTCYLIGGGGDTTRTYRKNTCYAFTIREKPTPVGGIWISPNKLELLTPWITLASTIISAVAVTSALLKHRKEKQ